MRDWIARLFSRKFAPPSVHRPRPRSRLVCEVLEARDVPAVFRWTGQFTTDAEFAGNWRNDFEIGPSSVVPGPGDDVFFMADDMGGNVDCDNFGEAESYRSVTISGYYSSTITLSEGFTTQFFQMGGADSATVDQPIPGTGITVTGPDDGDPSFVWTNGTINSTENPSTITITGDGTTGLIDFGEEEECDTADTLVLDDEAQVTHQSGAVNFTAGNGVDIGALCLFTVAIQGAPPSSSIKLKNALEGPLLVHIRPGGECDVQAEWVSFLPVYNDGGRFHLGKELTATIFSIYGPGNPALQQTENVNGKTELDGGSILQLAEGLNPGGAMVMNGGSLWIRPIGTTVVSTIKGHLTVLGGYIQYDLLHVNGVRGKLFVDGDVYWLGGTLNAGYDATSATGDCTWWQCSGDMVIDGFATVNPVLLNGPTAPPTGRSYVILHALGTIYGMPYIDSTAMNLVLSGTNVISLVAP